MTFRLEEEFVDPTSNATVKEVSETHVFLGDRVLRTVQTADGELGSDIVYDFNKANMFVSRYAGGTPIPDSMTLLPPPNEVMEISLFALHAARQASYNMGLAAARNWAGKDHRLPSRFDVQVAQGMVSAPVDGDEEDPWLAAASFFDVGRDEGERDDDPRQDQPIVGLRIDYSFDQAKWLFLASTRYLPIHSAHAISSVLTPPQREMLNKYLLYTARLHPAVYHHITTYDDEIPYHLAYTYRSGEKRISASLTCTGVVLGGSPDLVRVPESAFDLVLEDRKDVVSSRVLGLDDQLNALLHKALGDETALLALSAPSSIASSSIARAQSLEDSGALVQAYIELLTASLATPNVADLDQAVFGFVDRANASGDPSWTLFRSIFANPPPPRQKGSPKAHPLESLEALDTQVITPARALRASLPDLTSDTVSVAEIGPAPVAGSSSSALTVMAGMSAFQYAAIDAGIELMKQGLLSHPYLGAVYKDLGVGYWYRKDYWDAWSCFRTLRRLNPKHSINMDVRILEAKLETAVGSHYF